MGSISLIPVLAVLTLGIVLALVWYNIQQTLDELYKTRARGKAGPASAPLAGSAMK
ncbi:MAG: hypothetical protein AAGB15_06220 [Pseudomonadota bacterium]